MAVEKVCPQRQQNQQLEKQQARKVRLPPLHGAAADLLAGRQSDAQAGQKI
jgi:hypothetical protein